MTQHYSTRRSIEEVFASVIKDWEGRISSIEQLKSDVVNTLSEDLSESNRHEISEGFSCLVKDFAFLKEQATHPELTLATTGTTSSGKSTLANFLIGEEILPSATQEMSAGLVKVTHSQKRRLTIPETQGATWETGTWENLSASDVCDRLRQTMEAFRVEEEKNKIIEPVLFEIEWPIRLAERKKELGLPEGTQVTILDLPGLKAVNDERNGPVIRANIAKAFCLLAYNAEETDKVKQKTLLNQVVNQVIALRKGEATSGAGSLQRMLFLLNRIDAFWRDKDPITSLKKYRSDITDQLREKLIERMGEHKGIIDQIELAEICSLPALLAVRANCLWNEPEKQAALLEELDGSFSKIFPENYFKQFPRDLKDLEKKQRKDLIEKALECSYGKAFEDRLSSHIGENLPVLVVGGPSNVVSQGVSEFLTTLSMTIEQHIARTAEEADKRKLCLAGAETALKAIADKTIKMVEPIRDTLLREGESDSILMELKQHLSSLNKSIQGEENLLLPIMEIGQDFLYRPYYTILRYTLSLMQGEEPEISDLMIGIPQLETFNNAVEAFKNTAYGEFFEEGGRIEGGKALEVAEHLRAFVKAFSKVIQALVNRVVENSADRIQCSFIECSRRLLEQMKDECQNVEVLQEFEGLLSVFDKELNYSKPPALQVECDYEGGVVRSVIKTITVESNDDFIERGANWISNFLFGESCFTKEEKREEIVLDMPALGNMLKDMIEGAGIENAFNDVTTYVCNLVQEFTQQLQDMIKTGISEYTKAIDASVREVDDKTRQRNEVLEQYKGRIAALLGE